MTDAWAVSSFEPGSTDGLAFEDLSCSVMPLWMSPVDPPAVSPPPPAAQGSTLSTGAGTGGDPLAVGGGGFSTAPPEATHASLVLLSGPSSSSASDELLYTPAKPPEQVSSDADPGPAAAEPESQEAAPPAQLPSPEGMEPPPIARLGGTALLPVGEPPALSRDAADKLRRESGLAPDEHHDRVRGVISRLDRMLHRAQVQIVQQVEGRAAALGMYTLRRADEIPGVVAAVISALHDHIEQCKGDINILTIDMIGEDGTTDDLPSLDGMSGRLGSIGDECTDALDGHAETNVQNVLDAFSETSSDMVNAYRDELKPLYDEQIRPHIDAVRAYPTGELEGAGECSPDAMMDPTMAGRAEEVAEEYNSETEGGALLLHQHEQRAFELPEMAVGIQGQLVEGANQRAEQMASSEVEGQFTLLFLQLVDPAAVFVETREETAKDGVTTVRAVVGTRLASARERAANTIKLRRDYAIRQLEQIEQTVTEAIRSAGQQAQAALRAEARKIENGLLTARAPFADAWRSNARRINRHIAPGKFFDWRTFRPLLQREEEGAATLGVEQERSYLARVREGTESVDDAAKQQQDGLRSAGQKGQESGTETTDPALLDINCVADEIEARGNGEVAAAGEASDAYTREIAAKLSQPKEVVVERAKELLTTSMEDNFNAQVESYRTSANQVRDCITEENQGRTRVYASIDDAANRFIQQRVREVVSAVEYCQTFLSVEATDEDGLFKALFGLSDKGLNALAAEYQREMRGEDMRTRILSELENSEQYAAAEALLYPDRAQENETRDQQRARASALISVNSTSTWGVGSEVRDQALRALSPAERAALTEVPALKSMMDEVRSDLGGTDLAVVDALLEGNAEGAFALRLDERLTTARKDRKDPNGTTISELQQMTALMERDLQTITRRVRIPPESVQAFEQKVYHEHAWIVDSAQEGHLSREAANRLSDAEAQELFIQHADRAIDRDERGRRRFDEQQHLSTDAAEFLRNRVQLGADSTNTSASNVVYELNRATDEGGTMSEFRKDQVTAALTDNQLHEAERALDEARRSTGTAEEVQAKVTQAQDQLDVARAHHGELMLEIARQLVGEGETPRTADEATAIVADRVAELFGEEGEMGRRYGRSLVEHGRPDLIAATELATDRWGTHEQMLKSAYAGRSYEEMQEFRANYAEFKGQPGQLDTLDRELGTFRAGRDTSNTELSGDDMREVEILLLGEPRSDQDMARIAFWQNFQARETGNRGRQVMAGSAYDQSLDRENTAMSALLTQAAEAVHAPNTDPYDADGNPNPAAFDDSGAFRGTQPPWHGPPGSEDKAPPFQYQGSWQEFHDVAIRLKFAGLMFQDELQRQEDAELGLIKAIGTVLGVAALFIPGLNLVAAAALAASVAALTGIMTIAAKQGMRGARYGYEEMWEDVGNTVVETVLAYVGGRYMTTVGVKGLAAVKEAALRGVVTGGFGGMANKAMQDSTWYKGAGAGFGDVVEAGAHAALISAVTEGAGAALGESFSHLLAPGRVLRGAANTPSRLARALDASGVALSKLGNKLGPAGRVVVAEGLSNGLANMLGETAGLGFEIATGSFHGDLADALLNIGVNSLKETLLGGARSYGNHRLNQRYEHERNRLMRRETPPSEAELAQLHRYARAAGQADNVQLNARGQRVWVGREQFAAAVHAEHNTRQRMLSTLPPHLRTALASLPTASLHVAMDLLSGPNAGTLAQRLALAKLAHEANPGISIKEFGAALLEARGLVQDRFGADNKVRRRLAQMLPRELRPYLKDMPVAGLEALPAEGLRRLAAMIAEGSHGTPRERAELLALARGFNSDVDATALLRGVVAAVDAGVQALSTRRQGERERRVAIFKALPPEAHASLSALPDVALRKVLRLMEAGAQATPHERAALLAAARQRQPNLDTAAFERSLNLSFAAGERAATQRRQEARQLRALSLRDVPAEHRTTLSALPDEGIALLRALMAREDGASTLAERATLLRLARQTDPDLSPRALFDAVETAVAMASVSQQARKRAVSGARATMLAGLPNALKAKLAGVEIVILDATAFHALTRNPRAQGVTLIVNGKPRIVLREGASALSIREEGIHALQAQDPEWRLRINRLDESRLRRWDSLPLDEQLALYRTKVEIEVDAQHQLLDQLNSGLAGAATGPEARALREQIALIRQTLSNLKRRAAEVERLRPSQLDAMRKGEKARPTWLERAPRLFAMGDETHAQRVARINEQVRLARENNNIRDLKLRQKLGRHATEDSASIDLDGEQTGPIKANKNVFGHITLGAGYAGIANEMTRAGRNPDTDLVIGARNPWENAHPDQDLGQGAHAGVDLPNSPEGHQFKDVVADVDARYAKSIEHANHVTMNRDRAGIGVLDGHAHRIERRDQVADWPEWATRQGANVRVLVRDADGALTWFYAKSVDVAVGPGAGRLPGLYKPTRPGWNTITQIPADIAEILSSANKDVLSSIPKQQLDDLFNSGKLTFADQGFRPEKVPNGGKVLIYGPGAAGAWASVTALDGGADVTWVGQARDLQAISERPVGEGGDLLRAAWEKRRSGLALTDAENKTLVKFTFEEQRGHGALDRNLEEGGAFHPDTRDRINFEAVTALTRVEFDAATGKLKLYFEHDPTHPMEVDQLVLAIGQDAKRPRGAHELTEAWHGELAPILSRDGGAVVGLKSQDGHIRVLGSAATGAATEHVVQNEQAALKNLDVAAAAIPHPDSATVKGGFFHSGRMIAEANRVQVEGSTSTAHLRTNATLNAAELAFVTTFKAQHAALFPSGKAGRLSPLQIAHLSDEALAAFSPDERAFIRQHRLDNPFDAPPQPARFTDQQLADQHHIASFRVLAPELVADLGLSDAQILSLSDRALAPHLLNVPEAQREAIKQSLRIYEIMRMREGAAPSTLTLDQLVSALLAGRWVDRSGRLRRAGSAIKDGESVRLPQGLHSVGAWWRERAARATDGAGRRKRLSAIAGISELAWEQASFDKRVDALGLKHILAEQAWFKTQLDSRVLSAAEQARFDEVNKVVDALKNRYSAPEDFDTTALPSAGKLAGWSRNQVENITKVLFDSADERVVDQHVRNLNELIEAAGAELRTGVLSESTRQRFIDTFAALNSQRMSETFQPLWMRVVAEVRANNPALYGEYRQRANEIRGLKKSMDRYGRLLATAGATPEQIGRWTRSQQEIALLLQQRRAALRPVSDQLYTLARSRLGQRATELVGALYASDPDAPLWRQLDATPERLRDFLYNSLPGYLNLDHLLLKSLHPEHAINAGNLLLVSFNLHLMVHQLKSGDLSGWSVWSTLHPEIRALLAELTGVDP